MAARLSLLALVPLLGASCEEAPEPQATATTTTTTTSSAEPVETRVLVRREWLAPHDKVAPDRWLASRAAGVDVAPNDPSVASMHALLMTAQERFGDTTRMVANRAVQLETTLKAEGIDEKAPEIIASFSKATEKGRALDGFGAMCQRYSILRRQGMSKDEALARLAEELETQRPAAAAPSPKREVQ